LGSLIQIVHTEVKPFLKDKLIHKIQTDTYKRELERYGKYSIDEAESIFCYNSFLILSIIEKTLGNDQDRWLWGAKGLDVFLDCWGFDLRRKKDFFDELKTSFGKEMNTNTYVNKQLSKK
jgi:thiopeptide-type bacteriocin biosynthesis protein